MSGSNWLAGLCHGATTDIAIGSFRHGSMIGRTYNWLQRKKAQSQMSWQMPWSRQAESSSSDLEKTNRIFCDDALNDGTMDMPPGQVDGAEFDADSEDGTGITDPEIKEAVSAQDLQEQGDGSGDTGTGLSN